MAAVLIVGSGLAGLAAALVAWALGGGFFVMILCYAITANLAFSLLSLFGTGRDADPAGRGFAEEIEEDLLALTDSLREEDRTFQRFPELRDTGLRPRNAQG
ncbi:FAD-binding protein [Pseudogemmobacter humi]|uniref:FAD-dependent oxidoreductase 2 FAD-binding domain-containing protein n=1 Tax=Pseudogemmobacter humi TaxID=2483812 RepID=A0A3P5WKC1_9RHOB|nr:FAD-binding protein [Pseudogemmobacter humi]VDC20191.1 hypothetical protein XINFAN_00365 [Pseudogemmobacter humi]